MVKIVFPQKHLLEGELPFNMKFKGIDDRVDIWMLSTNIAVPEVIFKGEVPLYPFYWDTPENPSWTPRYEMLFGVYSEHSKHGAIHKRWGTQPLNTYIRGHFCLKPHPRAIQEGEHVLVQQYWKSGWWGAGDRITIKEQLMQNKVGLPLLRALGILKPGVNFHFFDQTKPTQDTFGLEYKLFDGSTLPDSYNKHLPKYLREWRFKDFSMHIEDVISDYVVPNLS